MKKIFCIGLSRTGTTSLCEALKLLGYPTLHFPKQLLVHPEVISEELLFTPKLNLNFFWTWRRRKEIEVIDFQLDRNLLLKYDAFGDLPIPLYFDKLDQKFSGSKFIYTYRDEEKWLKSMKWLLEEGAVLWSQGLLEKEILLMAYNCFRYDEQALIESYRKHHSKVNSYFLKRPEDLLSVNIDEQKIDFKMLCNFLEIDSPDIEFPNANGSKKVSKKQHINYWFASRVPFYEIISRKLNLS